MSKPAEYIDGFVAAVPAAQQAAYIEHARRAAEVFREYGALELTECWGDDVPDGEVTSFPMAVQKQPDEVVVLSWIRWPSKAVRDAAMPTLMEDPRLDPQQNPMPFDGKRMIFGGFAVVLAE